MPTTQAATRPTTTAPEQGSLFTPEQLAKLTRDDRKRVEDTVRNTIKPNLYCMELTAAAKAVIATTPGMTWRDKYITDYSLGLLGPPDKNGDYWHGVSDSAIANAIGVHRTHVNTAHRRAETAGLMEVTRRRVWGRGNRRTLGIVIRAANHMAQALRALDRTDVAETATSHVAETATSHVAETATTKQVDSRESPLKGSLSASAERETEQELAENQHPRPFRGGADSSNEEEADNEQAAYGNQNDYSSFAANNNLHTQSERQPRPQRTKTGKRPWRKLKPGECRNDQNNPDCLGATKADKNGKHYPRCWPCQDTANKAKRQHSHSDAHEHKRPRAQQAARPWQRTAPEAKPEDTCVEAGCDEPVKAFGDYCDAHAPKVLGQCDDCGGEVQEGPFGGYDKRCDDCRAKHAKAKTQEARDKLGPH